MIGKDHQSYSPHVVGLKCFGFFITSKSLKLSPNQQSLNFCFCPCILFSAVFNQLTVLC